jgi:alanine racemase
MPIQQAVDRLQLCERQAGRLNPLSGIRGSIVLDDTYNSSPASAHAALDTLAALPASRRIVVFGDMLELGDAAVRLHQEVGQHAAQVADVIVTKGDLAAEMQLTGQSFSLEQITTNTVAETIAAVRSQLQPGDLVLVKGSAEARMEQVVAGLLASHVNPAHVLVRQERAFEMLRITDPGRPTWIEIDLDAIANNMRLTQGLVGAHVRVLATLKADAYGHGAIRVARTLLRAGAWGFAVATLSEAQALRNADIDAPILILGYTPAWQVRDAIRLHVRLTVFDRDVAREISLAAQELQIEAIVHVKVDTGMARLGLHPSDVLDLLRVLHELPSVQVEGIFTHFASADSADERFAQEQLRRFTDVLARAAESALRPPLAHAANSAAILRFPEAHFDLVRPGLSLYGLAPSTETPLPSGFRPALSFKTEVAQVKTLPAGTPISYGGTFVTARESRIATIPVGYADGFRRSPRWIHVLVKGSPVPIVGRVAMDYTMLDVTDVADVRAGDEVVLIGTQGSAHITADDVAEWLDTINYEVVAAIMPRVPRTI